MNTFRLLSEEQQEEMTEAMRDHLPEDGRLAVLSYTGSRAFGWGRKDSSDIDAHGFFATEDDWFHKCHSRAIGNYDITLTNIKSLEEPEYDEYRWKQYYDMSNPVFIHDDFNYYEDFMDDVEPGKVHNIYPYDVELQRSRYDNGTSSRNALHTYKEYMIALNYLWYDEIETNIVEINKKERFQLSELESVVDGYKKKGDNLDHDVVAEELDWLDDALGETLEDIESFREKRRKL